MHPENLIYGNRSVQDCLDEFKPVKLNIEDSPYITFNNDSQIYIIPTANKPVKMVFEQDDFAIRGYKHEAFEMLMARIRGYHLPIIEPKFRYGGIWNFYPYEEKKPVNLFETEE